MIEIRDEQPGDAGAIRAVNDAAFGQPTEGAIVDALRASCDRIDSLVAVQGDAIIGHVLFSPVELKVNEDGSDPSAVGAGSASPFPVSVGGMGLAPLAVLPAYQRQGVGSLLVREGLARVRDAGAPFVVVLGHPEYYPRFGFERASKFHVRCPWVVPDDAFMLMEFVAGAFPDAGGTVHYRDEFNAAI